MGKMGDTNRRFGHSIKHFWHYFRKVKPQYFIVLAVLFGVISLVSLRHNNEQMIRLRDAVYAADKNGGDVEKALRNLRQYVYSHMNTSLASGPNAVHPPIQLKYTYERLQKNEEATLSSGNSSLYNDAQNYCDNQSDVGSEVITCIQNYATEHGANLATIPDGLYKFDFTSAKWSADTAGWSIVITSISLLAAIVSALYHWWIKRYLV